LATQGNKFTRQATERKKRSTIMRDEQPTVDEQLARLEEDIRRLKVEFDIFFNGAAKRPPYDTKGRVETLIKRLADDRTLTFAQRYRYNSLVARHTSFLQLWRRTLQGREEGRDAASAARAAAHAALPEASATKSAAPRTVVCADPHTDVKAVKSLFEALVEAKRQCGESADELSFPRFHHMIASRTDAIKEKLGCERVQFSVEVKDGRVNLKAKAEKE
jgi:hypothetical protein